MSREDRPQDGLPPTESADDPRVTRATEEYLAQLRGGEAPDRAAFLSRYPEIAGKLAECLDGLEFIQGAAPRIRQTLGEAESPSGGPAEAPLPSPLGDFRIVRQVGRGGMNIVYEA